MKRTIKDGQNRTIKVDRFCAYGYDNKFLAICGSRYYYRIDGEKYGLLAVFDGPAHATGNKPAKKSKNKKS